MHRNMLEICCLMVIVVWGASTMADDPIAISVTRTGLYGCPLTQSETIQIRIESFKSSSGSEFHRHTIVTDTLVCFEDYGSSELSATDFKSCADATEAAGMRMFHWANDNCTAYVQGIRKKTCSSRNEDTVLYSLDDALPERIKVGTYRHVSSFSTLWDTCHPVYPSLATSFRVTWNGAILNAIRSYNVNGKRIFVFQDIALCVDDLGPVTFEAFDADGKAVMEPITQNISFPSVPGHRYKLVSGNCLYIESETVPQYQSFGWTANTCNALLGRFLFQENKDGEFEKYLTDLQALNGSGIDPGIHFLGANLKLGRYDWFNSRMWLEDNHTAWNTGEPILSNPCVILSPSNMKVSTSSCSPAAPIAVTTSVCYEHIPL